MVSELAAGSAPGRGRLASFALSPYGAIVLGATAIGGALRLLNLGGQSFDGDELYTAWYVHSPLHVVLSHVVTQEKTPYPYFLLIWAWGHLFGDGEVALRSLSVLAGIATVPIAAAGARQLGGWRVGGATALLVAVNPFLVWYSQQARPYALLALLGSAAFLFFAGALTSASDRGGAL